MPGSSGAAFEDQLCALPREHLQRRWLDLGHVSGAWEGACGIPFAGPAGIYTQYNA